jgi:hypothetical protein
MQTLKIKCYRMNDSVNEYHFFILSKGLNSGKPMNQPCPNCFVCFADNEAEKDRLFWLCFGLWQGGYFQPFLTGSVIPFIRIDDLKEVIRSAASKIQSNYDGFTHSVELLRKLDDHQRIIHSQLQLIKQAKKAIMYKTLK